MTDAAELDATLDGIAERMDKNADRLNDLAERVDALAADLGIDGDGETAIDVRVAPPSDLEAMLADAPDERDVSRLEARLSALEEHMGHRGPGACPCPRCERLRRLRNGEGPDVRPFGPRRVTLAENGDEP